MEITQIRIFPIHEEKLKAYVTITLDDCFIVHDLRIIQGNRGLFVAMPNKKLKDGSFKDIAHPLNSDTRKTMEDKILAEFARMKDNPAEFSSSTNSSERDLTSSAF